MWSLSHWTTREVPRGQPFILQITDCPGGPGESQQPLLIPLRSQEHLHQARCHITCSQFLGSNLAASITIQTYPILSSYLQDFKCFPQHLPTFALFSLLVFPVHWSPGPIRTEPSVLKPPAHHRDLELGGLHMEGDCSPQP